MSPVVKGARLKPIQPMPKMLVAADEDMIAGRLTAVFDTLAGEPK
jgi:hypothetical protein